MLKHLVLVALALAPAVTSQTQQLPLPAFASTYSSATQTRGFYFQTPVDITITGLRVPDEGAAGVQCVEVSALAGAPPAFPATASGGQVFYAANVPSSYVIPCNLNFTAGSWIGVMGACGTTTMNSSYGTGPFNATIAGQPVTMSRFLTQTNLNAGGGQPYSGIVSGSIGRVEVYYNTPSLPTALSQPAFNNTYSDPSGTRGFYFTTPVPIIIRGLRVPDESGNGTQNVEVKRMSAAPPAFPATTTGGEVFYANNVPSYQIIPCNLPFQAGDVVGILGACGTTTMRNSYATPAGPFVGSIAGNPVTLTRMGTQTNLNTSSAQPYFDNAVGQIARVEVYYELATGMATSSTYGTGCISASRAFYEFFTPAASFDLSGTAMTLIPVGGRYTAVPTGTYVPPTAAATVLALGDDTDVTVALSSPFPLLGGTTNSIDVCSNGFVSAGASTLTAFTPSVATWLGSTMPRWGTWHDFNPAAVGSGQVKYEEVGNMSYITWDGVFNFVAAGSPNYFQIQLNRGNGRVTYAWLSMTLGGNNYLVGYAAGGAPAADLGSLDISAQFPAGFATQTFDQLPLAFNSSARPVIGSTIDLVTSNITAGSAFGATLLGFAPDNSGLGGLGAPGCSRYVQPLATNLFFIGGSTVNVSFPVVNDPFLLGLHIFGQSATYSPGQNPLSVLFSNGLDLGLDLL
jgi:hypothetical protein